MDIKEAKQSVIRAGRELAKSGLIAGTWGNVSARLDEESFVITASGKNYMTLTEEEVIRVKLEDLSYEGNTAPSSELKVHREIYRHRRSAQFVIHTHQENASAISAMSLDHILLDKKYEGIGNLVYCAEYALPGTEELCRNVTAAVEKSQGNAVIMKNHGAVCFGKSEREAFEIVHNLEKACGAYLAELNPVFSDPKNDVILEFAKLGKDLYPFLDDFAQMIGGKAPYCQGAAAAQKDLSKASAVIVKGLGALYDCHDNEDREAMEKIMRKNCKAFFAAQSAGVPKPIDEADAAFLRNVYLKKYSKLKDE